MDNAVGQAVPNPDADRPRPPAWEGPAIALGFLLAFAFKKLGNDKEARVWYDKAVDWMMKNRSKEPRLLLLRVDELEPLRLLVALQPCDELDALVERAHDRAVVVGDLRAQLLAAAAQQRNQHQRQLQLSDRDQLGYPVGADAAL